MPDRINQINGTAPTRVDAPFGTGAPVYAEAGWSGLIPLHGKTPAKAGLTGREGVLTVPAQYVKASESSQWARKNIGMRLPRGYIGIDVDAYGDKPGAQTLADLEAKYGPLPSGPSSTSRDDGISRIRLFKAPEGIDFETIPGPGIEAIQFHHRHITCWPSVHPDTGCTYVWSGCEGTVPRPEEIPQLPAAWVEGLTAAGGAGKVPRSKKAPGDRLDVTTFEETFTASSKPKALDKVAARFTKAVEEGKARHDSMLRACGAAARDAAKGWYPAQEARTRLESLWDAAVPGEGREREFDTLWQQAVADVNVQAEQDKAEQARQLGDHVYEDAYMAETVAAQALSGRFAWTRGAGWLCWNGRLWSRCDESGAIEAVRQFAIDQHKQALDSARNPDDWRAMNSLDGWRDMLAARKLRAVTGLARALVTVGDGELDADPDLLNVLNGVVDLRTGELSAHDPALMMTRIAGAAYDPFAASKAWDTVLEAIPEEVREYLQTRAGQAATGHRAPDDVVPLLNGGGSNGKSTWAAGLAGALGSYHVLVPDALLLGGAQRDESMTLRGARYALIEETPEAAHLNSTMLKKSTSPEMSGHHLYQSETTWQTTHSLFITTNYKPVVTETDEGTWRRLELIEFPYRFTSSPDHPDDRQGDPTLRSRVEAGDPEILGAALAWIVTGAMRWYGKGRVLPGQPVAVQSATRGWREETDLILAYWGERLEPDPQAHVMSADLLADFNEWAVARQQRVMSDRGFGPKFESHSESRAARVTKGNIRRTAGGLSRPVHVSATSGASGSDPWVPVTYARPVSSVPDRYRGWHGLRFRNPQ